MDGPAGSTATKMNHRLRGNRSNQCMRLFIDYLYIHFTIKNIPKRISRLSGHAPGPRSRWSTETQTTEGRLEEREA